MLFVVVTSTLFLTACSVKLQKFTPEENNARVQQDLDALFQHQEPINGPLNLNEAIARALKYNLDHRLKMREEAVVMGQLEVANMDLLPSVAARASAGVRNNADTTFNESKTSTSTSSDRDIRTADLTVSWNVLDFAIGYLRANQRADLALIVHERRRNVIHTIVNDTRKAYWRAVAAERALKRLDPMLREIRNALAQSQRQTEERVGSVLEALTFQNDLMQTLRELENQSRQLVEARTRLAVLLNIHPGTPITLADASEVPDFAPAMPLTMDAEEMELIALRNRSELKAEAYQLRVNQREAKVAILEMIPGLSFMAGINHTSDSFKVNSQWYDASLNLSWNLMNIVKWPSHKRVANSQIDLSKIRRLALSMAVISQTNVARLRFQHARSDYELASKLASVQERIAGHLSAGRQARTVSEGRKIQGEVRSLLSSLQRDMAYADLQATYGGIFASIGADPLPAEMADNSIASLADAVGAVQEKWSQGDFNLPEKGTAITAE